MVLFFRQLLRHRKNVVESYKEPISLSPIHSTTASSTSVASSASNSKFLSKGDSCVSHLAEKRL